MRKDASDILLKQRIYSLVKFFPEDKRIEEFSEVLKKQFEEKDQNNNFYINLNKLRHHIADVYRIHNRLIRTRRKDAEDWVFYERGPSIENKSNPNLSHVKIFYVEDDRYEDVYDYFQQYLDQIVHLTNDDYENNIDVFNFVIRFFESIGSDLNILKKIITSNKTKLNDEFYNLIIKKLDTNENNLSRYKQLCKIIDEKLDNKKLCIFSSNADEIYLFYEEYKNHNSKYNLMIYDDIIDNCNDLKLFIEKNKIDILLCSKNEEEGLNLHFFDTILHLDLPFSPSRLEQRIGRLDRFGRTKHVDHWIILPQVNNSELNLWEKWYKILAFGFLFSMNQYLMFS